MISFSHLNLGIFFLLNASRTTFSQDTDIENLSQRVEKLSSDFKRHDDVLKQVESSMNTYIFKRDYDKLEEIVPSKLELIHSGMKNMYKILREFEDSKDNLANKQTELDSKLEKILTEVEGIKDISKVAKNISYEVSYCTDNLANKQTELDSKLEKVLTEVEGIKDISKVARNISYEVSYRTDNLANKQTELDSKLEKVLTEVEGIKDISKVARKISYEVSYCKDNLANKQTELDSKVEKVLTEVEGIKDFSKVARNISYEVSYCKETCVNNQNEIHSKLDKVLSESAEISEVARNFSLERADCDELRSSSDSIPDNKKIDYFFGIGELVKFDIRMVCIKPVTKLTTRPIGTQPTLFHTGKFFNYYDALKECENRDGVVFIPKTKEENDLWISFAKNSHTSSYITEAFYPKTYYHEIKRFLWADCTENSSFFKIKLLDSQFYLLAPGYVTLFSNSVGAICIKYRYVDFFSDHCERSREGFAICERV